MPKTSLRLSSISNAPSFSDADLKNRHLERLEAPAPANDSPRMNIQITDVTWGDNPSIYTLFEVPLLEEPLFPDQPAFFG